MSSKPTDHDPKPATPKATPESDSANRGDPADRAARPGVSHLDGDDDADRGDPADRKS